MTDKERARRKELYETKYKPAYDAWIQHYPFTLDDLDGEQWAWIPDYEGLYQESTFGRTKSFRNDKLKILKPFITNGGYLYVNLHKKSNKQFFLIHRLVAGIFVPNPLNKPQINHCDGNKFNNHATNLEWVTGAENERHAVELGLLPSGENNWQASLTEEQVAWCRKVYIPHDNEWGIAALARRLSKDNAAVQRAVHGHTYKSCGIKTHKIIPKPPCVSFEIRQEIKLRYKKGVAGCGAPALAKEYGLGETTIYRIIKEK